MTPFEAVAAALVTLAVVWLKFVRPVAADVAWARQGERIERAKARRLARRKRARPA